MVKRILTFKNEATDGKPPSCPDLERIWTYLNLARDSKTYEQYEEIAEIKREFKKHGDVKKGFNGVEMPHIIEFKACCESGCRVTFTEAQLRRAIASIKSCASDQDMLRNANAEELISAVHFLEGAEKVEE